MRLALGSSHVPCLRSYLFLPVRSSNKPTMGQQLGAKAETQLPTSGRERERERERGGLDKATRVSIANDPIFWALNSLLRRYLIFWCMRWPNRMSAFVREGPASLVCAPAGFFDHLKPPRPPSSRLNYPICATGSFFFWLCSFAPL